MFPLVRVNVLSNRFRGMDSGAIMASTAVVNHPIRYQPMEFADLGES